MRASTYNPRFSRLEDVFAFLVEYKATHDGNSPTIRQICAGSGISSTCVARTHMEKLKQQGRISYILSDAGTIAGYEVAGGYWSFRGGSCQSQN